MDARTSESMVDVAICTNSTCPAATTVPNNIEKKNKKRNKNETTAGSQDENDIQKLIRSVREPRFGIPPVFTHIAVIAEVTNAWTKELLMKLITQGRRYFYYNLEHNTIEDARQLVGRLNEAKAALRESLGIVKRTVQLLLGLNNRMRFLGLFCRNRTEIILKTGDRFIITTDRRMCRRGCRIAVYCNAASALGNLPIHSTIVIGQRNLGSTVQGHSATSVQVNAGKMSISGRRSTTPNEKKSTSADATNVQLVVEYVHDQSIVCRVQRGGRIRPRDPVHLPVGAYDISISTEGVDNINFALECGALAIIAPHPKTDTYHRSLVTYVRKRVTYCRENDVPMETGHLMIMTHCDRITSASQMRFIAQSYDGVLFEGHKLRQLNGEKLHFTKLEVALMETVKALRKPFIFITCSEQRQRPPNSDPMNAQEMVTAAHDMVLKLPNVTPQDETYINNYVDGYLVLAQSIESYHSGADASSEQSAQLIYQYTWLLNEKRPREMASSYRHLIQLPLREDATRTGNQVLARLVAVASFSLRAECIFVATRTGRTAINLAAWHPACLVTAVLDSDRNTVLTELSRSLRKIYYNRHAVPELDTVAMERRFQYEQDRKYLYAICTQVQRRLMTNAARVIIVCRSAPNLTACDTFHTCTPLEFVRRFEIEYGVDGCFGGLEGAESCRKDGGS